MITNGHAALPLQIGQQIEDLGLHGDIERCRRLVGNQQFGFPGQRDGDHHTLLHATGELERVFVQAPLGIGNADLAQQVNHTQTGRLATQSEMAVEHLTDLLANGQHRIRLVAGSWKIIAIRPPR